MSQTFADYNKKPEYVYIIAEKTTKFNLGTGGYTGYYKVGQTDNLQERLEKLQTANPHQLECIGWIQVDPLMKIIAEKAGQAAVRDQYKSDENGGTEWFRAPLQYQAAFMQQVLRGVRANNVAILGTNIH
jgi:hypothetical protein